MVKLGEIMKKVSTLIILMLIFILSACGGNQPEPTPTPEPTALPTSTPSEEAGETETDEIWARIQDNGEIVVGLAADYPPFEYYTEEFQLDGYDVALIREIGTRLGLNVRLQDQVFPGLTGAIQLQQIDLAISALSITPEREAVVDFSNVYYVGEDALLGLPDVQYDIQNLEDLAQYRIGVQRGSVYEDWLRDELVQPGLLPQDHLFTYVDINDSLADLSLDRIDLVVLDLLPAEVAVVAGNVEIVAQGLNSQRYAIAMPQGAERLRAAVNDTLIDLQNEGFLAELAQRYLNIDADQILPIDPGEPVEPGPEPTECVDGMAYVADLNLNDNNMNNPPQMLPGQVFRKGWRLENIGTCTWDGNYSLTYVNGNSQLARMGGAPVFVDGQVQPGEIYDFWVDLVAPVVPGTYQGFWSMRSDEGLLFGQRVWVGITVPAAATPAPTQTPAPQISFTASATNIEQGDCVTFTWRVENIQAVWFYPNGADYTKYPTTGSGNSVECPTQTTTYNLRVEKTDGTVDTRQITIYVQQPTDKPSVDRFTVTPTAITGGQCVEIKWSVSGDVTNVRIGRNEATLCNNAPLSGHTSDCPPVGVATYYLEVSGPGGSNRVQQNVNVSNATAVPTNVPTPTATPQSGTVPRIEIFSVTPQQIGLMQCVTMNWSVTGDPDLVQIWRNDLIILGPATNSGSGQDCSINEPGSYVYRITAENEAGQAPPREVTVVAGGGQPYPAPLPATGDGGG